MKLTLKLEEEGRETWVESEITPEEFAKMSALNVWSRFLLPMFVNLAETHERRKGDVITLDGKLHVNENPMSN